MNIVEILRRQTEVRPEAVALATARGALTFAALERESAQVAALLRREGIGAGDAVLVFYPMSAELYVTLLGIFRVGAMAMFLDPSAGRTHIERCCALQPPEALIASAKAHLLRLVSPVLRRIPKKMVIGAAALPGAVSLRQAAALSPLSAIEPLDVDAPALLTFTSGSTGAPKAAMRTHGFLLAQHRVLERSLDLRAGEFDLTTLPIFVLANLASGVTSLIPDADLRKPGAIDPAPVLAQIHRQQVMTTAASPALLERLADHCERRGERLASFRRIHTGGAPVFPRLLEKLQRVAPQAQIVAVYGSTEAEPIAHIHATAISQADYARMRAGAGLLVGEPVPEISLRILRAGSGQPIGPLTQAEFDARCAGSGKAGEIVVSGKHVLPGYWHGQGNEESKFSVAGHVWHRTGDAGYLDDAGRVWLLGRWAARIVDERGDLFPFAVETAAMQFAFVRRAAVVAHRGRRVLAIEPAHRASDEDWHALAQSLAWAQLDDIRALHQIPVDNRHNAKVDYPALAQRLAGELK